MIHIFYTDHVIYNFNFNIRINSLNGKLETTTRVPGIPPTMLLSNQPLQQSPLAGNTFTSTQATPLSTGKTNKAKSEAHTNGTHSKNNLLNVEEDAGVILELPEIAGCISNNAGPPSNTHVHNVVNVLYMFLCIGSLKKP